jgi:protein-tyrosine phosphatase
VEEEKLHQDRGMPLDATEIPPGIFRVCMVCTGNICRSPMAEIVLRDIVQQAGLAHRVSVTSAGTGDWHVGEQADPRTIAALADRGFDASQHRAKQFDPSSFDELDLIIALDRTHERAIRSWATSDSDRSKIRLLTSFDTDPGRQLDVPDPYYADAATFAAVLSSIERACAALFSQIEPAFRAPRAPQTSTLA